MYYIYGISGPSLLIESTDSMIPCPTVASVFGSLPPSVPAVRPALQWPGSGPSASAGILCEREDCRVLEVLPDQQATGST